MAAPDVDTLAWLSVVFGLVLICVSLLDIGLTVLHIQAESPLSVQVNRAVWSAYTWLSSPLPEATRGRLLSWGFPLMIASTITFWVLLFIAGYGLIYVPFMAEPEWFRATGGARADGADAFYFSAVSFLTTGYGDIVPIFWLARLLAVSEGALGLLTISLAVTYLLSVYPLVTRKQALAAALNQENAGRADGVAVAIRFVGAGRDELLGSRLRSLNDELLVLGQAHGVYPLLFYARPRDAQASFARVLVVIQGLVCALRYLLRADVYCGVAEDPRLIALEEGLLYTLHQFDRSEHLTPNESRHDERLVLQQIEAALQDLRAAGLETVSLDDVNARANIVRFRRATDPFIVAYARNLRYPVEALWAVYSRGARDTALDDAS